MLNKNSSVTPVEVTHINTPPAASAPADQVLPPTTIGTPNPSHLPLVGFPEAISIQQRRIDSLLADAQKYAERSFQSLGHVTPAIIIDSTTGQIKFEPKSLQDGLDMASLAHTARLICVAYNAAAAVLVLQVKSVVQLDEAETNGKPSPSGPVIGEAVWLTCETVNLCSTIELPITRKYSDGSLFLDEGIRFDGGDGTRFEPMILPKQATAENRTMALATLSDRSMTHEVISPAGGLPAGGHPQTQSYQVVFACKLSGIVSMRIDAKDSDEATEQARKELGNIDLSIAEEREVGADNILTRTEMRASEFISARPCPENPFDLTGLDLTAGYERLGA